MIKIVGHRVLVRPFKLEEVDEAYKRAKQVGIQLLENEDFQRQQNAVDKGTVVAVGNTAFKDFGGEPWCAVGDFIAFAKYSGKYVEDPFTKEKFVILNDEDVVCVFEEKS